MQTSLNSATSELQTVKDSQLHQKKRINEMLVSLLKDLNEVGTIIGTSNDAMKVLVMIFNYFYVNLLLYMYVIHNVISICSVDIGHCKLFFSSMRMSYYL